MITKPLTTAQMKNALAQFKKGTKDSDITKAQGGTIHMAEGGAAFGVYPQMKGKRSKQDKEAAKNVPVDLARGFASGVLGAPGDIESLIRMLPGLNKRTVLPTSAEIEKRLPFRSESPVSNAAAGLGTLAGGFYAGPGAPIRLVGALPGALKHGAEEFVNASTAGIPHVIKPKGGNWINGGVEDALKSLKGRVRTEGVNGHTAEHTAADTALNNWVDRNLTNYVKKEMATPEDPVRKLADQGITHLPKDELDAATWLSENMEAIRRSEGFPGAGLADTEAGRGWENLADEAIQITAPRVANEEMLQANPWLSKLDPNQSVYRARKYETQELGFNHIMDVLRQDVAAGRIRPEQLNKVSMEQAVRRTYEFDQEMARKMREAAIKNTEGMPVHKEYPEGYKWIELAQPKNMKLPEGYSVKPDPIRNQKTGAVDNNSYRLVDKEGKLVGWGQTEDEAISAGLGEQVLKDALKYEGDTMGHCVGGYCPDVLEGKSRIFSLRSPKGEPHVTIEVQPPRQPGWAEAKQAGGDPVAIQNEAKRRMGLDPDSADDNREIVKNWDGDTRHAKQQEMNKHFADIYREQFGEPPQRIVQIKGKQNAAPKADYLPYVQDFVRGGKWSDVGDFHNTGLIRKSDLIDKFSPDELDAIGAGEYLTKGEHDDLMLKALQPTQGMKRGGNVKMDKGGAVKSGAERLSKEVGELRGIKHLSFEDYTPHEVELVNLEAHEQGKGHGTNAMHKITSAADKHNINLMLIPAGDESKRDRLSNFYGRFGFSNDGDVMRRRHKAKGGVTKLASGGQPPSMDAMKLKLLNKNTPASNSTAKGESVNAFDYENPSHVKNVATIAAQHKDFSHIPDVSKHLGESLSTGSYKFIEDPRIQQAIKKAGHVGYYIQGKEGKQSHIIRKAIGGGVQPSLAQMRMAINQVKSPVDIQRIGVNEAPNMSPKLYLPPVKEETNYPAPGGVATQSGMPIGGIDQGQQPGQQLMPQQAPQQPPQGMPGAPGQPPMGAQPQGGPGGQQGSPLAPQAPTPPMGNMLQMTPQGQTMAALGGQQKPPGMARGGSMKGKSSDVGYLVSTTTKPNPLVGQRFKADPQGNLAKRQQFDIMKQEGRGSIVPIPYDATTRDRLVTEVSGHKLDKPLLTEAGFDYSLDPRHMAEEIGGASNAGIASRVQSRIDQAAREHEGDVFLMPNTMSENAENFSHHPAHIVLDLLKQSQLNKKTMKALSDDLRSQFEVVKTPKGYVKTYPYKKFLGYEHPNMMEQVMKGGHGLETTSGNLRKKMMERLGQVNVQRLLDYNMGDLKAAILDPELATDPKSYMGHTVVRAKPGAPLRPSRHSSYDTDYTGINVGGMGNRPLEIMMPDVYSDIHKELTARPAKTVKTDAQMRAQVVGALEKRKEKFAQPINARVINNAGLYAEGLRQGEFDPKNVDSVLAYFKRKGGYKKGGKVKLAPSQDTMQLALTKKKAK